ncbi:UDP-4-amino-4,6-dideoxy-N-acetyl-beta-L-altrosamine N-acetyltransferase [uncultured Maricaulis sp.]|uniref:UDP-4-amino-4, 6-dideoxy-N-acetyl-beta-L-altrosamine N-acetyltransferase n=1 Tax=uncultured Maricaulis sp. TaxID=174710 RepID=UPI0030DB2D22
MTADLRPMIASDKWQVLEWRNRDHVRSNMYSDRVISRDTHDAWFDAALKDPARLYWIIRYDGTDVGVTNLDDIDPVSKTCDFAIYIGNDGLTGKGIGSAVERAVITHVFGAMNFERLGCEVLCINVIAINVHRKFGFVETTLLPGRAPRADGALDAVRLELNRENCSFVPPTARAFRS